MLYSNDRAKLWCLQAVTEVLSHTFNPNNNVKDRLLIIKDIQSEASREDKASSSA